MGTEVLIGLLAVALGLAIGRYAWPVVRGVDPTVLAKAQAEAARSDQECCILRNRLNQLEGEHKSTIAEIVSSREEAAKLNGRTEILLQKINEQAHEIGTLRGEKTELTAKCESAQTEIARLSEREAALKHEIADQAKQLDDQNQKLTTEFENIANRILKENASDLSDVSHKSLAAILEPLRERIKEFQSKIENTYDQETREVLSLKEQIKLVLATSTAIGTQADGLAKALRGDPQKLGRWGELALERILDAAGLKEGREYITQGKGLGLKDEEGRHQRPDIVVLLPEKRTMIIDSKVPLTNYDRLVAAQDEALRILCADQFVGDMKRHIDDLAARRYQENEKLQAHDCVLMFVPIEGALAAALTREPELFVYGWNKRVVLVGPPTLLMTMRTVASIWRYEQQGENAQEIAQLAGELCDKITMSLLDFNAVAEKITTALNAHYEAVKRLATGKGNALNIGDRIRSLGVKTKKAAPSILVHGVAITATTSDSDEAAPPADASM
jgi:DNA recombination protein RmuC